MTIAISIKVNDGVVLAADSASTLVVSGSDGHIEVHNVYTNADKIFNLRKGDPHGVGVMTWGIGSIGQESISTLMKDLRQRMTGGVVEYEGWQIGKDYTVRAVADLLRKFIYTEKYRPAFENWPAQPSIGFLVAGYTPGQSLAEEYRVEVVNGECGDPQLLRPQEDSGISWHGEPEAVTRLVLGFSSLSLDVLRREFKLNDEQISRFVDLMRLHALALTNPAMPIQDAIDLAGFLVDMTMNFSRFSPGATTVDGPIEIAAITKHEGFKWIRRKHYFSAVFNPPIE